MIDGQGSVRITDFGLAGIAGKIEKDEVRFGTPAYMAPEQRSGRKVSIRSVLYCLGLILYELFTGRRVFNPSDLPMVLGLEEQLAGTLIDYIGLEGHVAVGFEGGQHQDPQSVDHLEAIVWIALGELGLVDIEAAWLQAERDKLVRASAGAPAILEMTYRHAITGDDAFSMLPGFASFEP